MMPRRVHRDLALAAPSAGERFLDSRTGRTGRTSGTTRTARTTSG
ncbi:hypothetical protein [Streptomyces luteolus]|uniref:Uncharacterized protein n=1 Tax=Streptomyces luteolus TaxID=3043615 RepID=A0ABT6SV41_9ACTN|nr:hypothetical protein [Streptomyces sp. B-S-A12]MDI3419475.1 hypothetical protein [Streptomyces sp. B-S-A12]